MTPITAYLFAAMTSWSPLSAHAYAEAPAVTEARYARIAEEVAATVADEAPLFAGNDGRAKTALYVLAIASYESGGFRADVLSCQTRGDGGRSYGLYQSSDRMACESVHAATVIALRQVRQSWTVCHDAPQEARLGAYTAGNCEAGARSSATRVRRAQRYWTVHPFTAE